MSCGRRTRRYSEQTKDWPVLVYIIIVVGVLFLAALLVGCSALEPPVRAESNKPHTEFHAETIIVDGTTRCVVVSPALMGRRVQSDAGVAISCDWQPAAPGVKPKTQNSPYPLEPEQQPGRVVTR